MNAVNQYFGILMIIFIEGNVWFQKIFITSPLPRRAREGGSKRRQFSRGWGVAHRGFFSGDLGKIGEVLIN